MKNRNAIILITLCLICLVVVFIGLVGNIRRGSSDSYEVKIVRPSDIGLPEEFNVFEGVLVSDALGDPAPGGLRVRTVVLRTQNIIDDSDGGDLGGFLISPNDITIGRILEIEGFPSDVVDKKTYWRGNKFSEDVSFSFYGATLKKIQQSIVVISCAPKG